jgi:plastocyanin
MGKKAFFILALILATGAISGRVNARAANSTYTVLAGLRTLYGVDVLGFGPQTLKVHRGDTVTWKFQGFHNVRFDVKPADVAVQSEVDGKTQTEMNPIIAFANAKTGEVFKAGIASGLLSTGTVFSVVMDAPPGLYTYVCDIHPGMIAVIEVVEDSETLPPPDEVVANAQADLEAARSVADQAIIDRLQKNLPTVKEGTLNVSLGAIEGIASIDRNYPEVATITVGQTVVWYVPQGFEHHTVNFPIPQDLMPPTRLTVKDGNGKPHMINTTVIVPNIESNAEFPADGIVRSGQIEPGQSFSLRFTKPGIYGYYCALHTDQIGVIKVVPVPTPAATPAK